MKKNISLFCSRLRGKSGDNKTQGKKGEKMGKQNFMRLQKVKRIIEAMDCEFALDDDNSIWVNDGDWQVFLPDQPASEVVIRLSQKLHSAVAADIGARFTGVATLMGLDVTFNGNYDPNCDASGVVLIQEG